VRGPNRERPNFFDIGKICPNKVERDRVNANVALNLN
jgi:hypothetical protein